jgi:cysteine desulfurase / selenocysteine lyase
MIDYAHYRASFPITAQYAYLNHAATAPLGDHVRIAIEQLIARRQREPFDHIRRDLGQIQRRFRERAASLIGAARSDEIVVMPNTAAGINTAANSLPLVAGDNLIILDGDYPANIYPWHNLAHRGIEVRQIQQRDGGLDLEILEASIDRRTRVIALSSVMFASGFRNDLMAVGQICRERGIFFVVDAIQSVGVLPVDVQAWQVDMLACGSQKWLLGEWGAGFLYCRRELLDQLVAGAYVGTYSVVDPLNYLDYNFTLQPRAERFNIGSQNWVGIAALDASMGLLLEVGVDQISERVLALTDLLIADLQRLGYQIRSLLDPARRSGIIVIALPDAEAAYARLLLNGVVGAVRGGGLRFSPHFYNSEEDVLRVGATIGPAY